MRHEGTKLCRAFYYSSKKIKYKNMYNTNIEKNHVAKFKNICVDIDTILELKTFAQAGNSYNDLIKNLIAEHKVAIIK